MTDDPRPTERATRPHAAGSPDRPESPNGAGSPERPRSANGTAEPASPESQRPADVRDPEEDADRTLLLSQRDALRALGVDGRRPAYDGDPQRYLRALQRAGEAAELVDRSGLWAFTWLVQAKGVDLPLG